MTSEFPARHLKEVVATSTNRTSLEGVPVISGAGGQRVAERPQVITRLGDVGDVDEGNGSCWHPDRTGIEFAAAPPSFAASVGARTNRHLIARVSAMRSVVGDCWLAPRRGGPVMVSQPDGRHPGYRPLRRQHEVRSLIVLLLVASAVRVGTASSARPSAVLDILRERRLASSQTCPKVAATR